jgi:hypothetical protein
MTMSQDAYYVSIHIRDVGDEPLTLFLIGIDQRPLEPGNALLVDWSLLTQIVETAGNAKLIAGVRWTLEEDGEGTIGNFGVSRDPCSDPRIAEILNWLVHSTKKANQSDGLKRAFRERKLKLMQRVPSSTQQSEARNNESL